MSAAVQERYREYELTYVLAPSVDNAEAERLNGKVLEVVGAFGGKLLKIDNWGRRKLAYPIKKNSRGIFIYTKFVAKAGVVAEIERNLRIADSVLRYHSSLINADVQSLEAEIDPEDLKFSPVTPAEPEEELSFEQRLGLVPSAHRRREHVEEEVDPLDELEDVPDLNAGPAAEGGAR